MPSNRFDQKLPSVEDNNLDAKYGNLPSELRTGEIDTQMQKILRSGIFYALLSILGVSAFALTSFVSLPFIVGVFINAWFAGSMTYLSGISYGIVNDLIATHVNLPYFTLGHQQQQRSLIESNDPKAVAVAWGILATSGLSLLAGTLFAAGTLITGLIGLPFASFVFPALAVCFPLVILGANMYARQQSHIREVEGSLPACKNKLTSPFSTSLSPYQSNRLKYWLKNEKDVNDWLSNSDRNEYGYQKMPLLGVAGLIGLITLSATSALLPPILFSPVIAVFPPLGLGILLSIGVLAACGYLARNHQKKVNNGFQLDFPENSQKSQSQDKKHHEATTNKLSRQFESKIDEQPRNISTKTKNADQSPNQASPKPTDTTYRPTLYQNSPIPKEASKEQHVIPPIKKTHSR